jgi:hypothetical protein
LGDRAFGQFGIKTVFLTSEDLRAWAVLHLRGNEAPLLAVDGGKSKKDFVFG